MLRLTRAELEVHDPHTADGGTETRYLCPMPACSGKQRGSGHRSLSVNQQTGAWRCFRCGSAGVLEERMIGRAQRNASAVRRAFGPPIAAPAVPEGNVETINVAPPWDRRPDVAAAVPIAGTPGAAYLGRRGVPEPVATAAGVLYGERFYGRRAVLFPLLDQRGDRVAVQGRHTDRGTPSHHTAGDKARGVFATLGAFDADPVVICEAPIDALSLAAAGMPALALCGTSAPPWLPGRLAFRRVALGLDADAAGDRAVPAIAAQLASFGATVERWRPTSKDWNDTLRAIGPEALAAGLGVGHLAESPDTPDEDEPDAFLDYLAGESGADELADAVLARAAAVDWPWVRVPSWWEFAGEGNWRATVAEASAEQLEDLARVLAT